MKILLAILTLLVSFGCYADPVDKYYIIIGQSNANFIAQYSDLSTDGVTAHLINCGYNGQPISYFRPSYSYSYGYGLCMKKALAAPRIDGIVFWQGEHDTRDIKSVREWHYAATEVLRSLRVDLGDLSIPIVMVALNNFPEPKFTYWFNIRVMQLQFKLRNFKIIDSSNYEFQRGNLHLTIAGYQAIGVDIGKIFTEMCEE